MCSDSMLHFLEIGENFAKSTKTIMALTFTMIIIIIMNYYYEYKLHKILNHLVGPLRVQKLLCN